MLDPTGKSFAPFVSSEAKSTNHYNRIVRLMQLFYVFLTLILFLFAIETYQVLHINNQKINAIFQLDDQCSF